MTQTTAPSRRLIILGSTGTIGTHSLEVVEHLDPLLTIVGLAAHRNAAKLIEQAQRYPQATLAIEDPRQAQAVRKALPSARIISGPNAAQQLVEQTDATDLLVAVVGSAALPATLTAITKGIDIALANKETLVAAGQLVMRLSRRHGVRIIPVDSEHSAIFQCLDGQRTAAVKRIVLTASGGPFRKADQQTIENATIEQALAHPTWRMGPKISIDSATMMNKALEIIEAHWLFDLPGSKIDVVIHPQSVVHSFVEFQDHSVLAQLGPPDMRTPIQYALTYPQRVVGCSQALDWTTLTELTFEAPDYRRFGALKLAYDVIQAGGAAGAVLNAANEQAVEAFLAGRIRFGRIVALVAEALEDVPHSSADSLAEVIEADRLARHFVERRIDA